MVKAGEGAEGGKTVGKREGRLDLDICQRVPQVPSYATA